MSAVLNILEAFCVIHLTHLTQSQIRITKLFRFLDALILFQDAFYSLSTKVPEKNNKPEIFSFRIVVLPKMSHKIWRGNI